MAHERGKSGSRSLHAGFLASRVLLLRAAPLVSALSLQAACATERGVHHVGKNNANETRTDASSGAKTVSDENPTSTEAEATTDNPVGSTDAGVRDASTGDGERAAKCSARY